MQLQDAADMHQGPLSGFQARSLRAAILRTGQAGTVDFLRRSIDGREPKQSRAESDGALEGARGEGVSRSGVWILGGLLVTKTKTNK